jgi:hypothetical protein
MANVRYAEAFATYGAKLKNVQWSVCADGTADTLVVSLWSHHFHKPQNGRVSCSGRFDRWQGPGNNEFRQKVTEAFERQRSIRVVISHTDSPDKVEEGADASYLKNTFDVKPEWEGRVSKLNRDEYEFEFWAESKVESNS